MFVEALTECPHLQSVFHSRYAGFVHSLSNSHKMHVKVLFDLCKNDVRTLTGSNIQVLQETYSLINISEVFNKKDEISKNIVKKVKDEDTWKVELLKELIDIREGLESSEMSRQEISDWINYIATCD